jgi:hypothetical protein
MLDLVVAQFEFFRERVIPKARVFISGPRELAFTVVAVPREIPRSARKTASLGMTPEFELART